MKVITSLESFPELRKPIVLTIGNFDGVHLGHQHILETVKTKAAQSDGSSALLTFSNPPQTILSPDKRLKLLTTLDEKLTLIEAFNIDVALALPFTTEFASQTAEAFLGELTKHVSLDHLVLGYDSRIGKDRMGDKKQVKTYAKAHGFDVTYCDEIVVNGEIVSSSRIRTLIEGGNLQQAEVYLGRQFSHQLRPMPGQGMGKVIGFSTLNFNIKDLVVPPTGVYSVWLESNGLRHKSIANLGVAPTVRNDQFPQLEVHVIDRYFQTDEEALTVIFHRKIRDEKKFSSIESLAEQIKQDIAVAKKQLAET